MTESPIFAINLAFAKPDPMAFLRGLNPLSGSTEIGLPLMGLMGTTFVVFNAFYQSDRVRNKGWKVIELPAQLMSNPRSLNTRVVSGCLMIQSGMLVSKSNFSTSLAEREQIESR